VNSGLRWVWVAGALVTAVAGCAPDAKPATSSSATVPAEQVFAAGCPELSGPPFGIEAKGKRLAGYVAPAEQRILDRLVPGAQVDLVICQYSRPNSTHPGIQIDVRSFRGQSGTAQATTFADVEQGSTSDSYADFVTVPASGDNGGFAWYDEPDFCIATHSGNAYVIVAIDVGAGAAQDPDKQKTLRKQVPTLAAIMTGVLDALR